MEAFNSLFTRSASGLYCTEHIILLVLWFASIALSVIFVRKNKDNEKKVNTYIKILGLILFITVCFNRFFCTYKGIVIDDNGNSWIQLIPNTMCSLSSFALGLAVAFGKKDNVIIHAAGYSGLIGGIISTFYPDYLGRQWFWDPRTVTGLLHHAIMVMLIITMLVSGYFKPSFKKWAAFPIGITVGMTLGLFQLEAMGYSSAMQIGEPLLSSAPVLTSWYTVCALAVVVQTAIIAVFELVRKKKQ